MYTVKYENGELSQGPWSNGESATEWLERIRAEIFGSMPGTTVYQIDKVWWAVVSGAAPCPVVCLTPSEMLFTVAHLAYTEVTEFRAKLSEFASTINH